MKQQLISKVELESKFRNSNSVARQLHIGNIQTRVTSHVQWMSVKLTRVDCVCVLALKGGHGGNNSPAR